MKKKKTTKKLRSDGKKFGTPKDDPPMYQVRLKYQIWVCCSEEPKAEIEILNTHNSDRYDRFSKLITVAFDLFANKRKVYIKTRVS